MRTTTGNNETISLEQAVEDYRKNGYIKIDSSLLDEAVYLARTPWAARRIPDKSLAVYYPEEIAKLKGLPPTHIRMMHEAKKVFGRGCPRWQFSVQTSQNIRKPNGSKT